MPTIVNRDIFKVQLTRHRGFTFLSHSPRTFIRVRIRHARANFIPTYTRNQQIFVICVRVLSTSVCVCVGDLCRSHCFVLWSETPIYIYMWLAAIECVRALVLLICVIETVKTVSLLECVCVSVCESDIPIYSFTYMAGARVALLFILTKRTMNFDPREKQKSNSKNQRRDDREGANNSREWFSIGPFDIIRMRAMSTCIAKVFS